MVHTFFSYFLKPTHILSAFKRKLENIQKYSLFHTNAAVAFKENSYKPSLHRGLGFQVRSIVESVMEEIQVVLHIPAINQYLLIINYP